METLALPTGDDPLKKFSFKPLMSDSESAWSHKQSKPGKSAKMTEQSDEAKEEKSKALESLVCSKNEEVKKEQSDQTDKKDTKELKKKKKWRKINPDELGFNISLFPRPVRDNFELEKDTAKLWNEIEQECEENERITESYRDLVKLEGNNKDEVKYLRKDRHRKIQKVHKQVKTKHCKSVLNNKGRKAIYISHRVYKMMDLDIQRLCYMPSPKREKNIERKQIQKEKNGYVINPATNKPHAAPSTYHRPAPVQCLAHTIHKDNLPSDIDSALANLLMTLQHRDLTPEDYDLLLRLDEARVKPKTVSQNKLSAFKTETIESNTGLEVCPICMELYEIGQVRKYLPCNHAFHNDCIDNWLKNSSMNCPIDNLPIDS